MRSPLQTQLSISMLSLSLSNLSSRNSARELCFSSHSSRLLTWRRRQLKQLSGRWWNWARCVRTLRRRPRPARTACRPSRLVPLHRCCQLYHQQGPCLVSYRACRSNQQCRLPLACLPRRCPCPVRRHCQGLAEKACRRSARPQPLPPGQLPKCRLALTRDAMCSRGNAGARVAACFHQGLTARKRASLRPCNACQWRRSSRSQRRSLLCNRSQRLSCPACNHCRRLQCRPRQSPSRKFRRSTHTARRTAACLTPGRRCCTSTPRRLRPPLPVLLHQSKWRSGRRRRAIAASRTSTVAIVPAESVACSAHLRISERVPLQCSLSQIAEHICRPAPMQLHEL